MTQSTLFLFAIVQTLLLSLQTQAAAPDKSDTTVQRNGYVGTTTCAGCHQQQYQLWQGSHHDWAMKPATETSVLGNFDDVEFDHYGEKTRFSKTDKGFFVTTDNAAGERQTFKVAYTFGFYPLQQYLLPTEDGRLQALSVSWDSRPKEEGGQRWFHLYPDEAIPAGDTLHWTGPYQNWNNRCADCHSTNLQRNYQADSDSYQTQWSEVNVACEACHGPGQGHLQWLQDKRGNSATSGFDQNLGVVGQWLRKADEATASLQGRTDTNHQAQDVCGSCHSRRSLVDSPNKAGAYHQKHALSLLQDPLYHGDGQILDEVYVLGSFMQSKMHQRGVVCSNCHEPHSLELRADGNGVCAQCHNPEVFDRPKHHHHPLGSTGAQCANCHMPETTYMVVDPRRDHSLRIPRPDLSVSHGTPNACNQCHTDQNAQWAASALQGWLNQSGKSLSSNFTEQLLIGLSGGTDARQQLLTLAMNYQAPSLIQASALQGLGSASDAASLLVAQTQLAHSDPMVRAAAVRLLGSLPPQQRLQELAPLIEDPSKQVRMTAASQLLDIGSDSQLTASMPPVLNQSLNRLQQEYEQSLLLEQDTPAGQAALGLFYSRSGQSNKAIDYYQRALKQAPELMVASLNLADLYRELNREPDAQAVLRRAIGKTPQAAALHHALGLSLVRQKDYGAAAEPLAQAAKLAPEQWRYGYIYGVLLQHQGQWQQAQREWLRVLQLDPQNRELLMALLGLARNQQQWPQALDYAQQLQALMPEDRSLVSLIAYLRQRVQ